MLHTTSADEAPDGPAVTTTDLLKAAGLLFVFADHYGLFFDEDQAWWRVAGRLAAPIFFFLIGYAHARRAPFSWLTLGAALTVVDVWTTGEGCAGLKLNILFSFALLRLVLPWIERYVMARPARLLVLAAVTVALIRPLDPYLEYGMEGWLWAYLGLAMRLAHEAPRDAGDGALRRAVALGLVAATAYLAAEVLDLEFGVVQGIVLALLLAGLLTLLLVFRRGDSAWQPGAFVRRLLRFAGRHSFAIYAISLAAMQISSHLIGGDEA